MIIERVERAIRAVGIPIHGVSIGRPADRTTWRVDYADEATAQQRTDGDTIAQTCDVTDAGNTAAELSTAAQQESRRKDILATLAVIVKNKDVAAWNAMTTNQKVQAVRNEADIWKAFREFINDKAV